MLRRIPKLLLLVALLVAFAASSIPAFGKSGCTCFNPCFGCKGGGQTGGCQFNKNTSQCVNTGCKTFCY